MLDLTCLINNRKLKQMFKLLKSVWKMRVLSNFNLNGCKRRPLSLMTLLLFSLRKERKRVGEILKSLLIIEGVGKFRKILDYQRIKGEKYK